MAHTGFEYVRGHEGWDALAPDNWIVVRVDGRGFSKFSKRYNFAKPNDRRAVDLMNAAAVEVVKQFSDIVIAYGQSDEFSFVLHEDTQLFERRAQKLATTISTTFTVEYALQWPTFFPSEPLTRPFPTFDGRCVAYPKRRILRDYLSWRQADCHINNLYNTTFWALVQQGNMTGTDAELHLKGTVSADKNEILFSRFGVNYNKEPEIWRKGTVVFRDFGSLDTAAVVDTEIAISHAAAVVSSKESGLSLERAGKDGIDAAPDADIKYNDDDAVRQAQPHAPPISANKAREAGKKALSKTQMEKERKRRRKAPVVVEHVDIIKDEFWEQRPWILETRGVAAGGKR